LYVPGVLSMKYLILVVSIALIPTYLTSGTALATPVCSPEPNIDFLRDCMGTRPPAACHCDPPVRTGDDYIAVVRPAAGGIGGQFDIQFYKAPTALGLAPRLRFEFKNVSPDQFKQYKMEGIPK
jgi:hypothetical protein